MMHRRGQHARKKNGGPPPPLPVFADHTVGQHKTLPDADGWSKVDTKETKKVQRLRKWANKFIPQPPPLPRRADDLDRPHLRKDRHSFNPPLSYAYTDARDPYIIAANKHLKALNNRTLQTFAASLRISTLERPAWHDYAFGRKIRQFSVGRVGLVVKVPLFMVKPNDELLVIDEGNSTKFKDWLSTLPEAEPVELLGQAGYQMMYEWHRSIGAQKKCPRLNGDVMDIVLLHAIGPVRHVKHSLANGYTILSKHDNSDGGDFARFNHTNYLESFPGIPLGPPAIQDVDQQVMHLSKDLCVRAHRLLHFHTIKSFNYHDIPDPEYLDWSPALLDALTRVQLVFDDDQYFNFFKVVLPGCIFDCTTDWGNNTPAAIFRKIPNLNYLELWFHSPVNPSCCDGFWWHPNTSSGWISRNHVPTRFPCRRAMADYIMCFAYSWIHWIKSVNITGYVKTETRNHWLSILQDRKNRENHLKAVEMRIEGFQKQPVTDFPPKCECPVRCDIGSHIVKAFESGKMYRATNKYLSQRLKEYRFDFDDDFDTTGPPPVDPF